MSQLTDEQKHLLEHQYHNASNLNARIYLNDHFSTNPYSWQRWVFDQFHFQIIDIQSIPFEDEQFDAVIANFMLHHVPDRGKAFTEVRRVLKPGGRFYTATMGQMDRHELDELIARFNFNFNLSHPKNSFYLENGLEELPRWFSQVTLSHYHNELVVTQVEPLITYVLSITPTNGPLLTEEGLAQLTSYVEQEIATKGAFHITKNNGIFEAIKD